MFIMTAFIDAHYIGRQESERGEPAPTERPCVTPSDAAVAKMAASTLLKYHPAVMHPSAMPGMRRRTAHPNKFLSTYCDASYELTDGVMRPMSSKIGCVPAAWAAVDLRIPWRCWMLSVALKPWSCCRDL